jgi:hypothetical protein
VVVIQMKTFRRSILPYLALALSGCGAKHAPAYTIAGSVISSGGHGLALAVGVDAIPAETREACIALRIALVAVPAIGRVTRTQGTSYPEVPVDLSGCVDDWGAREGVDFGLVLVGLDGFLEEAESMVDAYGRDCFVQTRVSAGLSWARGAAPVVLAAVDDGRTTFTIPGLSVPGGECD